MMIGRYASWFGILCLVLIATHPQYRVKADYRDMAPDEEEAVSQENDDLTADARLTQTQNGSAEEIARAPFTQSGSQWSGLFRRRRPAVTRSSSFDAPSEDEQQQNVEPNQPRYPPRQPRLFPRRGLLRGRGRRYNNAEVSADREVASAYEKEAGTEDNENVVDEGSFGNAKSYPKEEEDESRVSGAEWLRENSNLFTTFDGKTMEITSVKDDKPQPPEPVGQPPRRGLRIFPFRKSQRSSNGEEIQEDPRPNEEKTHHHSDLPIDSPKWSNCINFLDTRAGDANETILAMLNNVDNPKALLPIMEDIAVNYMKSHGFVLNVRGRERQ